MLELQYKLEPSWNQAGDGPKMHRKDLHPSAPSLTSPYPFPTCTALFCFFSKVLRATAFLFSYMRVPAASSIILRVSCGFMLMTLVILPCMIRKWGLFTFSDTEWNLSRSRCSCHETSKAHSLARVFVWQSWVIMISKQQVLNLILLHIVGVQEVSIPTSNDDLARNDNLVMHLVPQKKSTGKMLRFYMSLSFLLYVLQCKTQAVVNLATNILMKGRHWQ